MSTYLALPSAINSALRSSYLSLANFRKMSARTTCLYSEGSTEPRSLLAESQRVSSRDLLFFFFLDSLGCFLPSIIPCSTSGIKTHLPRHYDLAVDRFYNRTAKACFSFLNALN